MRKEIQLVEEGLELLKNLITEQYQFQIDFEPYEDDEVDYWLDDIDPDNPAPILHKISQKYKDQAWAIVDPETGDIVADWEDDGSWQNPRKSIDDRRGYAPGEYERLDLMKRLANSPEFALDFMKKKIQDHVDKGNRSDIDKVSDWIVSSMTKLGHYFSKIQAINTLEEMGFSDESDAISDEEANKLASAIATTIGQNFPDGDPADAVQTVLSSVGYVDEFNPLRADQDVIEKVNEKFKEQTGGDIYDYYNQLLTQMKADAPERFADYEILETEELDELSINPFKSSERKPNRFDHIHDVKQLQRMANQLSREGAPGNPDDPTDARRQIHDRIRELEKIHEAGPTPMFPELDTKVISFEDVTEDGKPTGKKRAIVWNKDVQTGVKMIDDLAEGEPAAIYDWMDEKGYLELEIEYGFLFEPDEPKSNIEESTKLIIESIPSVSDAYQEWKKSK